MSQVRVGKQYWSRTSVADLQQGRYMAMKTVRKGKV